MTPKVERNFATVGIVAIFGLLVLLGAGLATGFYLERENGHLPQIDLSPFK